jgi:hypothetical protein
VKQLLTSRLVADKKTVQTLVMEESILRKPALLKMRQEKIRED